MYEIIIKKRDNHRLSDDEIRRVVTGYTNGDIPDYQMSAFLMAVYFNGMDTEETVVLTKCMAESGDMMDLSAIEGIKVDKHSTGGVGDKTTMVVGPIVAACGVPVAKMSGRGLGHTGGTLDKLEAIPGFCTSIDGNKFFDIVNDIGISVIGQTGNIAPADKKIYALRDVTATVDNLSLIASSIMSKKLASGADAILLDVKTGSGAFMKTLDDSIALAKAMVDIGEGAGRKMAALITDMDTPLGYTVGNCLEVIEAIETLQSSGPADLTEVCLNLAANMLYLADKGSISGCYELAKKSIESGAAFEKFRQMVIAQGGDVRYIDDTNLFEEAKIIHAVKADRDGYIYSIETESCGITSVHLGAGRERKEDTIDYSAGIVFKVKIGDRVSCGDILAYLHTSTEDKARKAELDILSSIGISSNKPDVRPLIYARVIKDSVDIL